MNWRRSASDWPGWVGATCSSVEARMASRRLSICCTTAFMSSAHGLQGGSSLPAERAPAPRTTTSVSRGGFLAGDGGSALERLQGLQLAGHAEGIGRPRAGDAVDVGDAVQAGGLEAAARRPA